MRSQINVHMGQLWLFLGVSLPFESVFFNTFLWLFDDVSIIKSTRKPSVFTNMG